MPCPAAQGQRVVEVDGVAVRGRAAAQAALQAKAGDPHVQARRPAPPSARTAYTARYTRKGANVI